MMSTNFKRIDRSDARLIGTALCGRIDVAYADLVCVFGEPDAGDCKTQAEWALEFDGSVIATIYDYKEYSTKPSDVRDWHIGGRSESGVVVRVVAALKDNHVMVNLIEEVK